jgi:hypothetical protein
MAQFPLNPEIKTKKRKCQNLTHNAVFFYRYASLEDFGVIKVNKVALSLMDDDVVGAEVAMQNVPLVDHCFVSYKRLSLRGTSTKYKRDSPNTRSRQTSTSSGTDLMLVSGSPQGVKSMRR